MQGVKDGGYRNTWPISYSFNHRYNNRSYLSIYTTLVKRNHSVTMVLPKVERLRNWLTNNLIINLIKFQFF